MAQRNSEYDRKERDFYPTPKWVTETLLTHIQDRLPPGQIIWEPACGDLAMAKVFDAANYDVCISDIKPQTYDAKQHDFVSETPIPFLRFDAIITNPPFGKLAQTFIAKALNVTLPMGGLVAMLLPIDFDSAKTRRHLFADCPAWCKKIVLTKRIVWFEPPPGAKGKSPSTNHAWYIWDWKHEGPPTIAYGP